MKCIYEEKEINELRKKVRTLSCMAYALAAVALLALAVICCLTTYKNTLQMERAATVLVILAGWVEIYIWINIIREKQVTSKHALMLQEEGETVTGRLELTGNRIRIRNSIKIEKVKLTNDEGSRMVSIAADRAGLLKGLSGSVKVKLVHSYIAGFEVEDEAD